MKRYALLLLLAMVTLVLLPGCAELVAASPGDDGVIEIVMDEYAFTPDVIRLQAGQTITIRLRNEGEKMHELMVGRDVQVHENLTEGFGEDFFAGVDVEIEGPGMVMGLEEEEMEMEGEAMEMEMGAETAGDHDEEGDEHDEEMEMGGMGTDLEDAMEEMPDEHEGQEMEMDEAAHEEDAADAGEHEEEMEMGGMGTEAEDAMEEMPDEHEGQEMEMDEAQHQEGEAEAGDHDDEEGEEHEEEEGIVAGRFGALQMPLMDAHAGLMIMVDPQMIPAGEVTAITFTVPEGKAGTWEIGCFQELGQHYDDGMNGVIIVEP